MSEPLTAASLGVVAGETYDVECVADMLGVSPRRVRQEITEGRLTGTKFRRRWQITSDALESYVESLRHAPTGQWVRQGTLRGPDHPNWKPGHAQDRWFYR